MTPRTFAAVALPLLGGTFAGFAAVPDAWLDAQVALFFSNPDFHSATVNRSGTAIAMIKRVKDEEYLTTYDLVKDRGYQHVTRASLSVHSFDWIDDNTLIACYVSDYKYFHSLYGMSTDFRTFREIGVNPTDHLTRAGTSGPYAASIGGEAKRVLVPVDALPYADGAAVVVDQSNRPHWRFMRFDRRTWGLKTIESGSEDVLETLFDLQGRYRLRVIRGGDPNEGMVYHRATEEEPWQALNFPSWWGSHGFDTSGRVLYLTYPENGKRVLRGFDLATGDFAGGTIADAIYDIEPVLIRDPGNGALLGFFYDADKPVVRYVDPTIRTVMEMVERSFPDRAHRFVGLHAEGGIIFESWGDRYPFHLSRFRIEEGDVRILGHSRPNLNNPQALGRMYPFTFETRDGETVRGYYTLPAGIDEKPGQPLPTVVLVHGGPRLRDRWEFHPEVQFYAHMGYAVLQVNYRGSSALYASHTRTVLDAGKLGPSDVIDATRWAIAEGIADPARIAISGGSFGGYIALACVADAPDLYQCAVGVAGVYELDRHIAEEMRDPTAKRLMLWQQNYWGNLEQNREEYRRISPLYKAEHVRVPVYLLHGGADDTVYRSQSTRMEQALRRAGVDVEIDTPAWFGHGALNEGQRIRYNKRIYRFIEQHLGAGREPAGI